MFQTNENNNELIKVLKLSGKRLRPHVIAVCDECKTEKHVRLDHVIEKMKSNAENGVNELEYVCRDCALGNKKYIHLAVVK